jgi:hypothetical protein
VGIWQVQKRFPQYGIPIWSLWQTIRFLPSIVAEKNVASYRYAILWEVFLDPSDSYFLFADLVGFYTHWTCICTFFVTFFSAPRYGVPIWSLWPNIRSLPSIVAEKNVTKNVHICSMCIETNYISWEALCDPSDSYFLFAEERGYHRWALAHSSSC